jgi:hypothetical protein
VQVAAEAEPGQPSGVEQGSRLLARSREVLTLLAGSQLVLRRVGWERTWLRVRLPELPQVAKLPVADQQISCSRKQAVRLKVA